MTTIRPARASDAGAIAALLRPIIRDTTITFSPTDLSAEDVAAQIAQSPAYVVATSADALLGFAKYGPFRGGEGYARTVEITLHLTPDARGRGTGSALLAHLADHARAAGKRSLIAGISAENDIALKFHAKHGFAEVGRVAEAGHKFGRFIDLVLMQKFL